MKELKVGIFSWFGYIMPFEERIKIIKESGFDAVSIWWEDEFQDTQNSIVLKKDNIPEIISKYGLILENIHAPFTNTSDFWKGDLTTRKTLVNQHIGWIKECSKFNIPIMVMHVSELFKVEEPNHLGIECFLEIVRAAEVLGVKVAIENTDYNIFVDYILSNIDSSNLGFCFDTSHNVISKGEKINLLEKHGHRLFATHISDNDGLKDRHWIPYNGNIDWATLKKDFPIDTYKGILGMELYTREDEKKITPKEFAEKAYFNIDKLKRYLQL
ncbi:sugar phosphate isomerase/epimerase [Clostridium sp. BSD9I1]|uniref:sugar phosphate isomerase/epimerase family protein n=1 Tax=Clostridium sp. BSD9I1 TaxID=2003589 RepID=UPI001FA924BC|nr:sugar phosphate isomerase/epimerase family protein [Clostridium sp. BSD9I1]